ncbi:MAG: hypothetical protein LBB81_01325 [Treponema sp.]|jgi:hypothetical protein|nr:hypothetical protein [Treponema sp.]
MKFLCNTEFFHSGVRLYVHGAVYNDITPKVAEQLIALDKKRELGALSFFTPVDEEAVNFIKGIKGSNPDPAGTVTTTPAPKEPTKAELIQEAKTLGIKATNFMSIEQLKEVIEAAKKAQQPNPAGAEISAPNANPQV